VSDSEAAAAGGGGGGVEGMTHGVEVNCRGDTGGGEGWGHLLPNTSRLFRTAADGEKDAKWVISDFLDFTIIIYNYIISFFII
jgi:hypothetical protein